MYGCPGPFPEVRCKGVAKSMAAGSLLTPAYLATACSTASCILRWVEWCSSWALLLRSSQRFWEKHPSLYLYLLYPLVQPRISIYLSKHHHLALGINVSRSFPALAVPNQHFTTLEARSFTRNSAPPQPKDHCHTTDPTQSGTPF